VNFYAHTHPDHPDDESKWEPLERHLREVAELTREYSHAFGAENWGWFAGLWHDLGKFHPDFQRKLRGDHVQIEHTGSGAALAKDLSGTYWETLAFVIAGHHAGLSNRVSREDGKLTPLDERVKRAVPQLAQSKICSSGLPESITALLFPVSVTFEIPERISKAGENSKAAWGCFVRMLFSALVDADSIATERFCSPEEKAVRLRTQPVYSSIESLQIKLDATLDHLAAGAPASEVNRERVRILHWCRAAAPQPTGFFTLNVPTGGGKTLASMSFALRHALTHRNQPMRRVIVAVPYTSIIEQNAEIYERALGAENVVQHHSNLDDFGDKEESNESTIRRRLACENWDAPVIVTTNVQLFESLFTHKRRRARKLHNIVGSVIILDEAQCVPVGFMALILPMLKDLVENYHCSVVICTATQPAWRKRKCLQCGLPENLVRQVIPPEARLSWTEALDRVEFQWPQSTARIPYEQLAHELAEHPCVLAIVHRKKDAQWLASRLTILKPNEAVFHLSTNMCPVHRRRTLAEIRIAINLWRETGVPCRVVSTQLVEAGVDLDLPVVYRAMAGLDSIAQAAGRCNREGVLSTKGRVVVFHAETDPPDGHLQHCAEITTQMLAEYDNKLDLRDTRMFEEFFMRLYTRQDLDVKKLLRHVEEMNFETVGTEFRLIEDSQTIPVVVLYDDEARARWRTVRAIAAGQAGAEVAARVAFRALQPYTVAVWPKGIAALGQALEPLLPESDTKVLDPKLYPASYDSLFGIVTDDEPVIPAHVLTI